MLGLTFKNGQSVKLFTENGEIEIFVSEANRGRCRLNFDLPDSVRVVRSNAKVTTRKEKRNETTETRDS